MVQRKNIKLNVEIEVAVPKDITEDEKRLKLIEDGILKVISKSMYEEGLAFKIIKAKFDHLWNEFGLMYAYTWALGIRIQHKYPIDMPA